MNFLDFYRLTDLSYNFRRFKWIFFQSFASLSDKSEASDTAMSLNDFMSEQYSDEASLDDVLPGKITSSLVFSIDELEPADEITEDVCD